METMTIAKGKETKARTLNVFDLSSRYYSPLAYLQAEQSSPINIKLSGEKEENKKIRIWCGQSIRPLVAIIRMRELLRRINILCIGELLFTFRFKLSLFLF